MLVRTLGVTFGVWMALNPGALTSQAAELVCLKSGFCLRAESHIRDGQTLSLQMGAGSIEVPAGDVATIDFLPAPLPSEPKGVISKALKADDPQTLLAKAADSEGVDRDFVRSVAKIESDFRLRAQSSKGAIGLMQLMPATAKDLAVDASLPQENAFGGAKYLRALLVRYRYNSALALAAYNAGPGAVQKFGGVPPYEETRAYILKVTREYDRQKKEERRKLGSGNQRPN